jgi:hypothetical protein
MRVLASCATSIFLAAALLQPALAEKKTVTGSAAPVATIELASEQMRLIQGGTAGKGTLHYNGKDYVFTFKTASAGLGAKAVTSVTATGSVFGLQRIEDFEGKYTSILKGVIAGSSQARAKYKNDKDVVIELVGTVKGAGLSLGGGLATIKLVKE